MPIHFQVEDGGGEGQKAFVRNNSLQVGMPSSGVPREITLPFDAFNRVKVSNPDGIFDSQHQYDKQPLLWDEKTTGTATITHLPNESSVDLVLGTASGDEIIRQSKQYNRYQPGKGQYILLTFVFGEGQSGTRKRVGYFDGENGIFLEQNGKDINIVKRTKISGTVSDIVVNKNVWNIDRLDGTGKSGLNLDPRYGQIFVIDLEWLGTGDVRCGFIIGSTVYSVHEFKHTNTQDSVWSTTANLPVRYEVTNTAAVEAAPSFKQVCSSVITEGGFETASSFNFSIATPVSGSVVNTAEIPILSIRPSATFNGITNRSSYIMRGVALTAQAQDILYRVRLNALLTSGSWGPVDASGSAMDMDTSSATADGGIVIDTLFIPAASGNKGGPGSGEVGDIGRLPFGIGIDADDPDILTITAQAAANGAQANASISWREFR
jgi:hypothetical protein